ncbi:MAG: AtpZ/AtpI family protein [Rhizomicrobium sp.]
MSPGQPDDIKALSERIAEAERKRSQEVKSSPTTPIGIASRFGIELVVAFVVGGAIGWGIDWAFDHWSPWHTRPWGIVVLTLMGAAAGIRNVLAAAKEINAELAAKDWEK